ADELADDRAVLLLHMGTVVLLPGAAAGEGDAMEATVVPQPTVDELGAVVAVEPEERHGEARSDAVDGAADPILALAPDGLQFDRRGGDVHRAQGAEKEALGARATVRDEIDFQEAGAGIGPLREGPDRDLLLEQGPGPGEGGAPPRVAGAGRPQEPGQRGPA